jgi:hypothetical protein
MPRLVRFTPLLIGTAALLWALGADFESVDVAKLEREFKQQQTIIDLALARIQLKASDGTITTEEAQSEIDSWVQSHAALLQKQAERAALLDRLAPLPPDPPADPAPENAPPLTPAQVRLQELDSLQAREIKELASNATSTEDLQDRIDAWAHRPTGASILQERELLVRQLALAQPLGTQPVVLEVHPNARPQEIEALEFQENIARRIQVIRQRHPTATVEEMQSLIDADKGFFEQNMAEIQTRLSSARREALAEEVERLNQEAILLEQDDATERGE